LSVPLEFSAHPLEYSKSKALYHKDKIVDLKQGKMIVPTELQVDPEAFCNDNCSFCSYRKEDGYNNEMTKLLHAEPGSTDNKAIGRPSIDSRISNKILLDLPYQMVDAKIPAIEITGGGEPTLHPKFTEFYRACGECQLDIGLVTNGSRLNDEIISLIKQYGMWVRISMDSSNAITHKKIHRTPNSDFDKRLNNIKKLVHNKPDTLTVGVSFIITPENYDDIESAARLFEAVDVDHIRFSWMYDKQGTAGLSKAQIEHIGEIIPKLQKELDRDGFKIFNEKNRIQLYTQQNDFKTCQFQRFVMAVGSNGGIWPCCIMKYNPKFEYANLNNNTLEEIINDMNVKAFMDNLNPIDCNPCWLADRNSSIQSGVDDPNYTPINKPNHANFI
jgi:sulfatase maturation enzyme AslB (radical SAM superfamily)